MGEAAMMGGVTTTIIGDVGIKEGEVAMSNLG